MKFFRGYLFYCGFFIFSFLFFIYLSFPYAILKEAVVSKLSQATGYSIRVKSLGPNLPLGFYAEGVQVGITDASDGLDLKSLEFDISLLSLLVGSISGNAELTSTNDGYFEVDVDFSIFDLFARSFIPSYISFEAEKFELNSVFRLIFAVIDQKFPGFGFVSSTKGNLNGKMEVSLDTSDVTQSSGSMQISLKPASLALDESFKLGIQNFEKAKIQADMKSGEVKIKKKSGFKSQLLQIALDGNVKLKKPLYSSSLNVKIGVELFKDLKDQIGPLLGSFSGSGDGKINVSIRGMLSNPKVSTK